MPLQGLVGCSRIGRVRMEAPLVIDWLTIPIRNIKSFKRPFDLVYCCPNLNVNASFYMRSPLPDTLVAVSETSDVPSRAHGRGGGRLASCTLRTYPSVPAHVSVTGVVATSTSQHHRMKCHFPDLTFFLRITGG